MIEIDTAEIFRQICEDVRKDWLKSISEDMAP